MKKTKLSLALSILFFSGALAAGFAHAQEAQQPDNETLSRHTATSPDSPPNTEADAPVSNQAKSKGFIEDSHLNLLLRSFAEHDTFNTVR